MVKLCQVCCLLIIAVFTGESLGRHRETNFRRRQRRPTFTLSPCPDGSVEVSPRKDCESQVKGPPQCPRGSYCYGGEGNPDGICCRRTGRSASQSNIDPFRYPEVTPCPWGSAVDRPYKECKPFQISRALNQRAQCRWGAFCSGGEGNTLGMCCIPQREMNENPYPQPREVYVTPCPRGSVLDRPYHECRPYQTIRAWNPRPRCRRGAFCSGGEFDERGICCIYQRRRQNRQLHLSTGPTFNT